MEMDVVSSFQLANALELGWFRYTEIRSFELNLKGLTKRMVNQNSTLFLTVCKNTIQKVMKVLKVDLICREGFEED